MTALERISISPGPIRLRVEDYLLLADSGAFADYAKTELIEGEIVAMNAQYSSHAEAKRLLNERLSRTVAAVLPDYHVWSEVSIALPPDGSPAPDLLVTNFRPRPRAITPANTVRLVVEIADTTLSHDLGPKLRIYARGRIPEYWVFDLEGGRFHQMWAPEGEGYAHRPDPVAFGDLITAATIERFEIETDGLN